MVQDLIMTYTVMTGYEVLNEHSMTEHILYCVLPAVRQLLYIYFKII